MKGIESRILVIQGMHCASCVLRVEKALQSVEGVREATVNLASGNATVKTESSLADDFLLDAVKRAGYSGKVIKSEETTKEIDLERAKEQKALQIKLVGSLLVGALLFWATFPGLSVTAPSILHSALVQLLLATPIQLWAGSIFYRGALSAIRARAATMDTLVVLGTSMAYFYSIAVTVIPQRFEVLGIDPMPYFDASTIIIAFVLLGRFLEDKARRGTSFAIRQLIELQPKTATVVRDGQEIEVPVDKIALGDVVRVKPGERVPVDGHVLDGSSYVVESMITGESQPVEKFKSSLVTGGTVNTSGTFTFIAEKVGKETFLSQIIALVDRAQGSKAPIQRIADRVASYFVPVVIGLAVITFVLWLIFGPNPAFVYALINSVTVLIIACPCAMGLATPTAIMVSTGRAAQLGFLIKDAETLEKAQKTVVVVFDKTGTLTAGNPVVTDIIAIGDTRPEKVLQLAASIEHASEHPLGESIVRKQKEQGGEFLKVENFSAIPGQGAVGTIAGGKILVGNSKLFSSSGFDLSTVDKKFYELTSKGKSLVFVGQGECIIGLIAVSDTVRPSAKQAVELLDRMDIESVMITGDNERSAAAIANEVGIKKVHSHVLPGEKEEQVRRMQKERGSVAMVGDGINDAPALAAADVSVALSNGSGIAIETAEITLMRSDLTLVPAALALSARTVRTIKQNLVWAFGYNVVLIPVAMGVLYPIWGVLVSPVLASAAMALSSVFVVGNSLRLARFKGEP